MWFLEDVYRLDETDARDAVCDHSNDKGIDGIYVDHNNEEVHFLQAKIRQSNTGKIGDVLAGWARRDQQLARWLAPVLERLRGDRRASWPSVRRDA